MIEDCFGGPQSKSNVVFISACLSPMYLGVGAYPGASISCISIKTGWPCPEKRDNELRVAIEFIKELTFGLLRSFP